MRKNRSKNIVLLFIILLIMVVFLGFLLGLAFSPFMEAIAIIIHKIWGLFFTCLGIIGFLLILIKNKLTELYTIPIKSATMVANELSKGNYKARLYEDKMDETRLLSQSINILARNLQQTTAAHEMQQDRLHTLIESMGSGLILIDGRGYINLLNKYFKDIFDIDPSEYLTKVYHEAFEHNEIISLVEEIFMTEKAVRKQMHLPLKIERRHFEVYGAPIIGTREEWKGVVLVFHDITELKKLEQMRKDFVANVSHELKTPMTSIKGFSETLLDGAMEDKETREYFLNIILKETDRLQSLINDLLDLSNIEQESFQLNISDVDLKNILEEVTVMIKGKAEQKEIDIETKIEIEHPVIQADLYRIKQIFINLINNALTYTMNHGKVKIECVDLGDRYKVNISDTGVGISKEQIPRIFERFYRVDKARSRHSGGTGLGLAIVKHIVEAHHGKIDVESEIDKGTIFSVILPKIQLKKMKLYD